MLNQKDHIKQVLLDSQEKAQSQIEQIKIQMPLTRDFLRKTLRRYIFCKYLLEETDYTGDDLNEITEYSLAKSLRISKDLVKEFDLAKSCGGGSSVITKKTLLLMAIQREFGVFLPSEGIGRVKTITDLSNLVWEAMGETEFWKPRLQHETAT